MSEHEEVRCPICKRLLLKARGPYQVEIKCPKCHNIVKINKSA